MIHRTYKKIPNCPFYSNNTQTNLAQMSTNDRWIDLNAPWSHRTDTCGSQHLDVFRIIFQPLAYMNPWQQTRLWCGSNSTSIPSLPLTLDCSEAKATNPFSVTSRSPKWVEHPFLTVWLSHATGQLSIKFNANVITFNASYLAASQCHSYSPLAKLRLQKILFNVGWYFLLLYLSHYHATLDILVLPLFCVFVSFSANPSANGVAIFW